MRYWATADRDRPFDEAERTWAELWNGLPKVVFSSTPTAVQGAARPAAGGLAEEIARWRAAPGDGDIAVGGADLAQAAEAAGLIDAYRLRVHPVLLGGGRPLFPRDGQRRDLELVDSRTFASGVLYLHYRVVHRDGSDQRPMS